MQRPRNKIWAGLVGLIMLTITACAQAFPAVQAPDLPAQPTLTEQVAAAVEQDAEAEPTATMEALPVDIVQEPANPPTDAPTATSPEDPAAPPPTEAPVEPAADEPAGLGDPALHATDPSTVNLASGKVQLVEFFAFW